MNDDKQLSTIMVDAKKQNNGLYDVYIATESSSGEHYTDVTSDTIGTYVADLIECLAELPD